MNKTVTVFILLFIGNFCFGQQPIKQTTAIFKNEQQNSVRSYQLPLKLICKFKDGKKQNLILENIENDTLRFKKYYNQQNFDCTINSIKYIKVIQPNKIIRDIQFSVWLGITSFLTTITIITPFAAKDESILAIFFEVPALISSTAITLYYSDALPFAFETNKWKVYVK